MFGHDPELFVLRKGSPKASSVHLMGVEDDFKSLRGDDDGREDTKSVKGSGHGQAWMKTDGFAVEINSNPSHCRDFFIPYTAVVLRNFYRDYGDKWRLSAVPVMELTKESVTGIVPHGVNEFGCLPDMDAYTLSEKTPPTDRYHNNVRYTGGHIHQSYIPWHNQDKLLVAGQRAIANDLQLGIPLVAMLGYANDYGEATRRTYYGQAGSFRLKNYGIEYRVLSSAIIMSPILYAWVLGVVKALGMSKNDVKGQVQTMHKTYDFDRMRHIINNHDVSEARAFVEQHRREVLRYRPEFYDLMVNKEVQLNANLYEAWDLGNPIRNHGYMGIDNFMYGRKDFARTVFPVKPTMVKRGWDF